MCQEHLQSNAWDDLVEFCNVSHDFNGAHFTDLCDMITRAVRFTAHLNFDVAHSMSNEVMHFWIGLNNEQFDIVLRETPSLTERCRKPRLALGIYLLKLRTGDSNVRLASQFSMSRRNFERNIAIVRECLLNDFINRHLGFDHIDRNDVLRRNLLIPKGLFGNSNNNKAIIICDGTYAYIQKSSNFLFQRLTYSLHKFQNLLKPFLITCTDGYIIDVLGPFPATMSDATIMSNIVNNEENAFNWFFHNGDVLILDRGFRDCVPDLESCGYEVKLPPSKDLTETQLTTVQANESRKVTICRWVIEVVNGRFKRDYKLLRQDYFNSTLRNLHTDFKIGAALMNCFHQPIADNVNAEAIVNIIIQKMNVPNYLWQYVNEQNLNRQRVAFTRIDANLPHLEEFPQLSESDITTFALGSYHLKLAKSYCGEHLQNGLYSIEVFRDNALLNISSYNMPADNVWLLRARIQSRHVSAKTYYCYILVQRDQDGLNALPHYYCTCLSGRRTVGSCAHIISIIWYLGCGRHTSFNPPAASLMDIIVDENH